MIRYVSWSQSMSSNIPTNPIVKMRYDAIWCNCWSTVAYWSISISLIWSLKIGNTSFLYLLIS
jgi:hypothetical protein